MVGCAFLKKILHYARAVAAFDDVKPSPTFIALPRPGRFEIRQPVPSAVRISFWIQLIMRFLDIAIDAVAVVLLWLPRSNSLFRTLKADRKRYKAHRLT